MMMKDSSIRLGEIQDVLCGMRRQESTTYSSVANGPSRPLPPTSVSMEQHAAWRPIIVEWMYKLCGAVQVQPSASAAAAYYIDVAVRRGVVAPHEYQLVALTAIHMAMKLYESKVFPLDDLLLLVREQGNFVTRELVSATERRLLEALDYHLHPPTVHCYIQIYLDLVMVLVKEQEDMESIRSDLEMAAEFFVQDVVKTSSKNPPSVVAYAAMLVALEDYVADGSALSSSIYDYDDLPESPRSSMAAPEAADPPPRSLPQLFVTTIRRMTGLGSDTDGLYGVLTDMSNSSSAASTCMVHAQHFERSAKIVEESTGSPRHVGSLYHC